MCEPTFTDGGFGWRSHRLNEPEQITDERVLQTQDERVQVVQTAHTPVHLCYFITGELVFNVLRIRLHFGSTEL